MIEVSNIHAIKKDGEVNPGALKATCTVYIKPFGMYYDEVKIFEKTDQSGTRRWIGLPNSERINKDGAKTFKELIRFDSDARKQRFRDQVMGAIDKYLSTNPDMTPEDVIKEDMECPY